MSAAQKTLPSSHRGSATSPPGCSARPGPWGAPTVTGFRQLMGRPTQVQDYQDGFPPPSAPPPPLFYPAVPPSHNQIYRISDMRMDLDATPSDPQAIERSTTAPPLSPPDDGFDADRAHEQQRDGTPCRPLVPGGRLNWYASFTLLFTLLGLMPKRVGRTNLLGVAQVTRTTGLSRFWTRRGSPQIFCSL